MKAKLVKENLTENIVGSISMSEAYTLAKDINNFLENYLMKKINSDELYEKFLKICDKELGEGVTEIIDGLPISDDFIHYHQHQNSRLQYFINNWPTIKNKLTEILNNYF